MSFDAGRVSTVLVLLFATIAGCNYASGQQADDACALAPDECAYEIECCLEVRGLEHELLEECGEAVESDAEQDCESAGLDYGDGMVASDCDTCAAALDALDCEDLLDNGRPEDCWFMDDWFDILPSN